MTSLEGSLLRTVQSQLVGLLPLGLTRGQVPFSFFSLRLEPKTGEVGPGPHPCPPPQQQNLWLPEDPFVDLLPYRGLSTGEKPGGEHHLPRLEQEGAVACTAPGLLQDTPSSCIAFTSKSQLISLHHPRQCNDS